MWERRSRKDGGAAAVEMALVFPLAALLVFGIMDFALLLRDQVAMTNLVRDASRSASTNPRVGNVPGHVGPAPTGSTCPVTVSDPYSLATITPGQEGCRMESFAYLASDIVEKSGSGLPKDSILDFWVYLANREGYPTSTADWKTDTNRTMTCAVDDYCVRYRWVDGVGFRYVSGTWLPKSINACPRSFDPNGQAVGVYMRVQHRGFFAFLPTTRTLTERNVVKFEPMRPGVGSCKP